MRIEVTQWDIDYAANWQEDPCRNPVAMAIRRTVGIPTVAGPGPWAVIDYATPWQTEVYLGDEPTDWLERFDNGETVEPFVFELDFDKDAHETRRAGRR